MSDRIVVLDVGGKISKTYSTTLAKSNYFASKLERWTTENDGDMFIDGDPDAFIHVLNFLRNAAYKVPERYRYELDYYGIKYDNVNLSSEKDPNKDLCKLIEELNGTLDKIFKSFTRNGDIKLDFSFSKVYGHGEIKKSLY